MMSVILNREHPEIVPEAQLIMANLDIVMQYHYLL